MYLLTRHDYTCRCSVCYAAQYGKQPEIQQGWQTSAVAIHLVVARLLSVSAIFCLDCMPRPFTKCRQLAAIAAIAAHLDLAPRGVGKGDKRDMPAPEIPMLKKLRFFG